MTYTLQIYYILVWEGLISLFNLLQLLPQNLLFWEKFVNFKFVQIFNSLSFSFGNDETRTQNLLILRQKPNRFWHADVLFRSWNLRLLSSSLIFYLICVCVRFCFVVLSGVSKPSPPNPGRREKIKLNFYFHTSLRCLKRFYEGYKGLHKTFWGTAKKCENKNLT